jgi:hypothetical protein
MANQANQILWYPTIPTANLGNFSIGDICINNAPSPGMPFAWQCTASGYPGTWEVLFAAPQDVYATTAVTGSLPAGHRVYTVTGATAPTLALPLAESFTPGYMITIINLANNTLTLTLSGSDTYPAGAIPTLAQYAILNLVAIGTSWLKAS